MFTVCFFPFVLVFAAAVASDSDCEVAEGVKCLFSFRIFAFCGDWLVAVAALFFVAFGVRVARGASAAFSWPFAVAVLALFAFGVIFQHQECSMCCKRNSVPVCCLLQEQLQ